MTDKKKPVQKNRLFFFCILTNKLVNYTNTLQLALTTTLTLVVYLGLSRCKNRISVHRGFRTFNCL